ncbi:MAG: molybdopterin-binding protein [bacterium]|nr:molybdopterin-binding protein [bacterium]
MRKVALDDAVGLALGHDLTEVCPERRRKGVAFPRGHVVGPDDLAALARLGKEHIYVWEGDEPEVHEDDAALMTAPLIAGPNIVHGAQPKEGKIGFRAACAGVFKVDVDRLERINALGVPSLPTIHDNFPVTPDKLVAAFRIIPLSCSPELIEALHAELATPVMEVKPYVVRTAAVLVTGNEVHTGRVTDGFTPQLTAKLAGFGVEVTDAEILPDDESTIAAAIERALDLCDLVLVSGGTSVDPDDVTVQAMRKAGVEFGAQGNPVQPGNNFTVGNAGGTTVCAVPAAALFFSATALDIFLPRILAGERITARDVARAGHGGLCHFCPECTYPICPFGRGA